MNAAFQFFRCLLGGFCIALPIVLKAELPPPVLSALSQSPVTAEQMSLWVAPVDGGDTLLDFNSDRLRQPASVTKVVTTGTGLLLLGKDYRWKTEFYTNGPVKDGALHGDLLIRGYGNPYQVEEALKTMVSEIQRRGLTAIDGQVILDNSYFIDTHRSAFTFDGKGLEPYNAIPDALTINFKTIDLIIDGVNRQPTVTTEPKLSKTTIVNRLKRSVAKKCRGQGFSPHLEVDKIARTIVVSGKVSSACRKVKMTKVLVDAGDLFYSHFKRAWQLQGGEPLPNRWQYGHKQSQYQLFYRAFSKPLSEQIRAMNKWSNNLMTRQLFLTIGAEITQPPSTLEKSRAVVMEKLKQLGIDATGAYIDNGSGLSRRTRFSAQQLGKFLQAMHHSDLASDFKRSLSIAGVDGTLRRRMKNTPLSGSVIGKTGTLRQVKSVAGYLTSAQGKEYVYVMLFNGPNARSGGPLMDNILQWIYNNF
ncbi:MAG: D-alanyl-D-alanine carboxypeptidase/D-alanyl-D-alanine-endopeptidase [Gammaproteobacteria bacterium]|nr:MAG: D-alanyl-D-alanine carboxypeptidase/D-alanyl-D-alanine-endopeptidase [Gammaproteobacteria bacterium]